MKRFVYIIIGILFVSQLSYSQTALDSVIKSYLSEINKDSLKQTMLELESFKTRYDIEPNHKDIAKYLLKKFQKAGLNTSYLDSFRYFFSHKNRDSSYWGYNVMGEIKGSAKPEKIYILCAHYDSYSFEYRDDTLNPQAPGADDNGSGTASIIEIARILIAKGYKPNATIRFVAFDAEEVGLLGSNFLAEKIKRADINLRMLVNNDMIGREINPDSTQWAVNVEIFDPNKWMTKLVTDVCQKYVKLKPIITQLDKDCITSDHCPFWWFYYPAVWFEKTDTQSWHNRQDLEYKFNYKYFSRTTGISLAMLLINDAVNIDNINEYNAVFKNDIKIYPNPAKDKIEISSALTIQRIKVLNLMGQTVAELNHNPKQPLSVDISNYKKGLYFIQLYTPDRIFNTKFIKE